VPSATGKTRLGLSISKGGGTSVQRNAIKRLIREAFRLCRGELPAGHDLIVSARPHEPMGLQAYQHALQTAAKQLADTWNARASKGRPG
jgi:ribonuclease P protein component